MDKVQLLWNGCDGYDLTSDLRSEEGVAENADGSFIRHIRSEAWESFDVVELVGYIWDGDADNEGVIIASNKRFYKSVKFTG